MVKIHPLLDEKRQALARRYEKESRLLGLAGSALTLVLLVAFYATGLSARLAHLWSGGPMVWPFLAYTACFLAWLTIPSLPLGFYRGYIREHKWNFSTQRVKGWFSDQAKSFAVGLIMAWLVLALLLWIMARFPRTWWLIAGLAMALVSVVMATLFPVVILPIFHRYTPIEDKELTAALEEILAREGLKSGGFFQEDMSRRTRKENAFEVLTVLPLMLIIGGAVSSLVFGPASNTLSRHFEKQADLYAAAQVRDKQAFLTALAGLANRNLGNAYPAWWVKVLFYTHPPIGERLQYIDEKEGFFHGPTENS